MREILIVICALAAALVLLVGVIRISGWLTSRKRSEDFKKERPDASSIHRDSGIIS